MMLVGMGWGVLGQLRVLGVGVRLVSVVAVRMPVVVVMVVVDGFGRVVGGNYVHFGGSQTAATDFAHLQTRTHVERRGGLSQAGEGDAGIDQGTEEHVAANAGKTFKISNTH